LIYQDIPERKKVNDYSNPDDTLEFMEMGYYPTSHTLSSRVSQQNPGRRARKRIPDLGSNRLDIYGCLDTDLCHQGGLFLTVGNPASTLHLYFPIFRKEDFFCLFNIIY